MSKGKGERERRRLIRFRDLQALGIVQNWPQLKRLVASTTSRPAYTSVLTAAHGSKTK